MLASIAVVVPSILGDAPAGAESIPAPATTSSVLASALATDGSLGVAALVGREDLRRLTVTVIHPDLSVRRHQGPVVSPYSDTVRLAHDGPTGQWLMLVDNSAGTRPTLVAFDGAAWRQREVPVPSSDTSGEVYWAIFDDATNPTHVVSTTERSFGGQRDHRHHFHELDATSITLSAGRGLALGDGSADPSGFYASARLESGEHAVLTSAPNADAAELRRYDATFTSYELAGALRSSTSVEFHRLDDGLLVTGSGQDFIVLNSDLSVRERFFDERVARRHPVLNDPSLVAAASVGPGAAGSILDVDDLTAPPQMLKVAPSPGESHRRSITGTFLGDVLVLVGSDGTITTASPVEYPSATLPASPDVAAAPADLARPNWTKGDVHRFGDDVHDVATRTRTADDSLLIGTTPSLRLNGDCTLTPGHFAVFDESDAILSAGWLGQSVTSSVVGVGSQWFGSSHGVVATEEAAIAVPTAAFEVPVAVSSNPAWPTFAVASTQINSTLVQVFTHDGALVGQTATPGVGNFGSPEHSAIAYDAPRNRYVVASQRYLLELDGATGELLRAPTLLPDSGGAPDIAVDHRSGAVGITGDFGAVTVVTLDGEASTTYGMNDYFARIVADPDHGRFLIASMGPNSVDLHDVPVAPAKGQPTFANLLVTHPHSDSFGFLDLVYDPVAHRGALVYGYDLNVLPFGAAPDCDFAYPEGPYETIRLAELPSDDAELRELPSLVADDGYWLLHETGEVIAFAGATVHGSFPFGDSYVDLAAMPDGSGYWGLSSSGRVFTAGEAHHHGHLAPDDCCAAAIVSAPNGQGYWIFGVEGQVWAFGDARSYGDLRDIDLTSPIVDASVTPGGKGYLLLAADGGVFAFGDATFAGSVPGVTGASTDIGARQIVVADGGYWVFGDDGGVFAFDTPFRGSLPGVLAGRVPDAPVVGAVPFGNGYLLLGEDGGVFNFSDLAFGGGFGGLGLAGFTAVESVPRVD